VDYHRPLGRLPLRIGHLGLIVALTAAPLLGCSDGPSVLDTTTSIPTATSSAPTTSTATTAAPTPNSTATTTTTTTTTVPLTGMPLPPEGLLYHGVYPGGITGEESDLTLGDLRSYEQASGKTASWVFFSHNWYEGRAFPLETAEWIREAGSIPYVRLMLRSTSEQYLAEPVFTLQSILDGEFDADLMTWCNSVRDFGTATGSRGTASGTAAARPTVMGTLSKPTAQNDSVTPTGTSSRSAATRVPTTSPGHFMSTGRTGP